MTMIFVNSSSECAPFISKAFEVESVDEFIEQTKKCDFDSFDNLFYSDEKFHQQIIDYSRKNIEQLMKG